MEQSNEQQLGDCRVQWKVLDGSELIVASNRISSLSVPW